MMLGQSKFHTINRNLSDQLERKKCLIAVHRGTWGGDVIQNTCAAYDLSMRMGGDMFEADVICSADGVLYCFHDGYERSVLGTDKSIKTMTSSEIDAIDPLNTTGGRSQFKIERLGTVAQRFTHGELYNIDRAWDAFDRLLPGLDAWPAALGQAVIKAPVRPEVLQILARHETKYMFMPICRSLADVETTLSYSEINTVGAEIIAASEQDALFSDRTIADLHAKGLFLWVNAITLGSVRTPPLYAGLDDDISLFDAPEKGWGRLFDKKIDVVQTDWPLFVAQYRARYFGF